MVTAFSSLAASVLFIYIMKTTGGYYAGYDDMILWNMGTLQCQMYPFWTELYFIMPLAIKVGNNVQSCLFIGWQQAISQREAMWKNYENYQGAPLEHVDITGPWSYMAMSTAD